MKNKSVYRIVSILSYISENPQGVTFSEIVEALDIPKSSLHDILQALYETECIYFKDPRLKSYAIGSTIFSLGVSYSKTSEFINVSKLYINDICEKINQPILLSKFAVDRVTHVYKQEAHRSILKAPKLGIDEDGLHSPIGKLFLAAAPHYLDNLRKLGITDAAYIKELETIREKQYVMEINHKNEPSFVIAVPIYNFKNIASGVISTLGIYVESKNYDEQINLLKDMAANISKKLGYKKKSPQ